MKKITFIALGLILVLGFSGCGGSSKPSQGKTKDTVSEHQKLDEVAKKAEEQRIAAEKAKVEEERLAVEKKAKAEEEARLAEEARQAEEARLASEKAKTEETKQPQESTSSITPKEAEIPVETVVERFQGNIRFFKTTELSKKSEYLNQYSALVKREKEMTSRLEDVIKEKAFVLGMVSDPDMKSQFDKKISRLGSQIEELYKEKAALSDQYTESAESMSVQLIDREHVLKAVIRLSGRDDRSQAIEISSEDFSFNPQTHEISMVFPRKNPVGTRSSYYHLNTDALRYAEEVKNNVKYMNMNGSVMIGASKGDQNLIRRGLFELTQTLEVSWMERAHQEKEEDDYFYGLIRSRGEVITRKLLTALCEQTTSEDSAVQEKARRRVRELLAEVADVFQNKKLLMKALDTDRALVIIEEFSSPNTLAIIPGEIVQDLDRALGDILAKKISPFDDYTYSRVERGYDRIGKVRNHY